MQNQRVFYHIIEISFGRGFYGKGFVPLTKVIVQIFYRLDLHVNKYTRMLLSEGESNIYETLFALNIVILKVFGGMISEDGKVVEQHSSFIPASVVTMSE